MTHSVLAYFDCPLTEVPTPILLGEGAEIIFEAPGQPCTTDYNEDGIYDCDGNCIDANVVQQVWGDGICDDCGMYNQENWDRYQLGDCRKVNLDCVEFNFDGGDCGGGGEPGTSDGCAEGYIRDCDGKCSDESLIGDGKCNDGTYGPNFLCSIFSAEINDCSITGGGGSDCASFWVRDCNGACRPDELLGNGECDEFFDCLKLDYDDNDCYGPPAGWFSFDPPQEVDLHDYDDMNYSVNQFRYKGLEFTEAGKELVMWYHRGISHAASALAENDEAVFNIVKSLLSHLDKKAPL